MSIEKTWNKLYDYWKNLEFDEAKKQDYLIRKSIGDDLNYSDDDIKRIKTLVSIEKEFVPIDLSEIENIEKELNVKLPEDYKKSLTINSKEISFNGFLYPWLGGGNTFLESSEIINFSLNNKKLDFEVFEFRNGLSKDYCFWNEKWVIVFNWNMDYLVVLDLREDEKFYGQVLCLCIEDGTIAKWADSFEIWFELAVNEVLEYGELRIVTIENLLGGEEQTEPITFKESPTIEDSMEKAIKSLAEKDIFTDKIMQSLEKEFSKETLKQVKDTLSDLIKR